MERRGLQPALKIGVTLVLALIMVLRGPWPVELTKATSLVSSYQILKNQYAGFIDRLKNPGGEVPGATEAEIEAFLIDLDREVKKRGALTEANFNTNMFEALNEVITWRQHRTIFQALFQAFGDEIAYTLANNSLHPSLVPLRNAVCDSVLGSNSKPGGGGGGGGSSGGGGGGSVTPTPTAPEPDEAAEATIEVEEEGSKLFSDLDGHWAAANINKLVVKGVITGYPDGQFKPENHITRAEFATVVIKAYQLQTQSGKVFNDTANHWARDYIATAAGAGLVNGYNATEFGPDDLITREQMAVMIVKVKQLKGTAFRITFTDAADIAAWAQESVATAIENNLITGYPDNTFRPKGQATRAEAVTLVVKSF